MEHSYNTRFSVVAHRVYDVIWDGTEKMNEIRESLQTQKKINRFLRKEWPTSQDTCANALHARIESINDLFNTVATDAGFTIPVRMLPAVDRSAVPEKFQALVAEIRSMQPELEAVEAQYSVDGSQLQDTLRRAVLALEAYLLSESPHASAGQPSEAQASMQAGQVCMKSLLLRLGRTAE